MRSAWVAAPPSREHNLVARLNHCSQKGLGACPGLHLAVGGRNAAARCPSATERPGSIECGLEQRPGIVGRMTESVCRSCGWYSTAGTNGVEPSFPASPACYGAYLELAASTRNEPAGTSFISRPSTLMPLSTPVRRQTDQRVVCARGAPPCPRPRPNRPAAAAGTHAPWATQASLAALAATCRSKVHNRRGPHSPLTR